MRLSTNLVVDSLQDIADPARKIEAMGFESLYISERKHEPFMQLAVAALSTERIKIGSEVALAFPRNPMVLAYTSWVYPVSSFRTFARSKRRDTLRGFGPQGESRHEQGTQAIH
jgi:hypothetical protein